MSSSLKITFEDWLADKTFEEYHFNREIQDHRYQISVQRLILEKRYRDIIKKREFIDDDTFEEIKSAQKTSFKKVRDSLANYHLERIESQKTNLEILEIKLNKLQKQLKEIDNKYFKIIENVYDGHDYYAFIWGGAHKFIKSTTIDQHFRFAKLAEDQIQSFGQPTPNIIEEETAFKELKYRLECAEILDLNIEIHINSEVKKHILELLGSNTQKISENSSNQNVPNIDRTSSTLHPEVIYERYYHIRFGNMLTYGKPMKHDRAFEKLMNWLKNDCKLTIDEIKKYVPVDQSNFIRNTNSDSRRPLRDKISAEYFEKSQERNL